MNYYFVCEDCGVKSEALKKNTYVRLTGGKKWVSKSCVPKENVLEKREFAGGYIIKVEDF